MNIVVGKENVVGLEDRYVILEMDRFKVLNKDQIVDTYCLIENVPLHEIPFVTDFKNLHENLIHSYRKKNWDYCEDAIEKLRGKWNKEVDSFYDNLLERIGELKTQELDQQWDGVVYPKAS